MAEDAIEELRLCAIAMHDARKRATLAEDRIKRAKGELGDALADHSKRRDSHIRRALAILEGEE